MPNYLPGLRVVVRGAGDLATAVGYRLRKAGIAVVHTERASPTTVRRLVAFSSCINNNRFTVEGITAVHCELDLQDIEIVLQDGDIPVVVDEDMGILEVWRPTVVVDATVAKVAPTVDLLAMAPLVVALGPGFIVGQHCHAVIETERGHDLGRVYSNSGEEAAPNSHVPGTLGGESHKRIIRSPKSGYVKPVASIGSVVQEGDLVARVDDSPVHAPVGGLVRGMVHEGLYAPREKFKLGDVDPRGFDAGPDRRRDLLVHISDKARALAGGVLEVVIGWYADNREQLVQ